MTPQVTYPVDALVSYYYFKADSAMKAATGPRYLRLVADSGAFSAYSQGATVLLDEYAEWLIRWRSYIAWSAALDVIGDPVATFRNWQTLRDKHGLNTVPTLHAGGDTRWLDVYAAEGVDFVGLGGLVGVASRALPWIVHVMRYARDNHPEMRFHAWGVTHRRILDALPLWSTDSSGIIGLSFRYGMMRLFNPSTSRDVQIPMDGRTPYKHRPLLEWYGVTPGQVARSSAANRELLVNLMTASVQNYAAWLRKRHNVSPPAWGQNGMGGQGTRIHIAESASRTIAMLTPGTRLPAPSRAGAHPTPEPEKAEAS